MALSLQPAKKGTCFPTARNWILPATEWAGNGFSPRASRRKHRLQTLGFSLARPTLDFWLSELYKIIIHLCCFNTRSLWKFVTIATENKYNGMPCVTTPRLFSHSPVDVGCLSSQFSSYPKASWGCIVRASMWTWEGVVLEQFFLKVPLVIPSKKYIFCSDPVYTPHI